MLTSILRTLVPALWGSFIGWVLAVVPVLEPLRADLIQYGDFAVPVISAVLIGGWYALWRWLEPRLPDWLTRILLGSAKAPVYVEPTTNADADQNETAYDPIPGTTTSPQPVYSDDVADRGKPGVIWTGKVDEDRPRHLAE